jgi:hypothetical protein
MGSPSFPVINGQVKTPLRWYASEQELNEVRPECNEADKPECGHFALLSPADSLPPFQVWSAPGPGIVSAWTMLYASDGTVAMDLADEIPQLRSYLFASASYTIYGGETLATILAQDTYRMTMVIDGVTYYSERFRIGCSGLLVNEEFEDMVGWRPFGTGITVAVDSVVMPGNPDAGDYEAGDYVINLGDDQIYDLLNDGVTWRSGTPDNGTYFYNSENGQWYEYQDGFQEITAPVQVGQVNGDWQMCWVGLPAATMVFDLAGILSVFTTYVFEFEIGNATTGKLVVTGPGFTFESTGNETVEVEQYLTYADVVGLQPMDGWDGCITRMTIRTRHTFEECAGELRWRHCSPVGNTYYGQNYWNKFYFDRHDITLSSEVTTVIETKENSRRQAVETLRRKDVDWTLVLGYLPWYLEDSLTEVPLVDTVELRMPGREEYAELEDVRVVAEADEIGDACLKLVSLKFRLKESAVSTGCCGPFDAPCDAPWLHRRPGGQRPLHLLRLAGVFHPNRRELRRSAGLLLAYREHRRELRVASPSVLDGAGGGMAAAVRDHRGGMQRWRAERDGQHAGQLQRPHPVQHGRRGHLGRRRTSIHGQRARLRRGDRGSGPR